MTVIAFRNGVLASDSQACNPQRVRMGAISKIFDLGDHGLACISGYAPLAFGLMKWFLDGAKAADQPTADDGHHDACFVLFAPSGVITIYEKGHHQPEGVGPYHAYGYGAEIAMGAMWKGATAEEAVQAAIDLCTECGGAVQVLRLNQ